jgi:hypothetical protein
MVLTFSIAVAGKREIAEHKELEKLCRTGDWAKITDLSHSMLYQLLRAHEKATEMGAQAFIGIVCMNGDVLDAEIFDPVETQEVPPTLN